MALALATKGPIPAGLPEATEHLARCLQRHFGAARFERYFGVAPAIRFSAIDGEGTPAALEIEVPSGFLATLLDRRFRAEVLAAAREATGAAPSDVRFIAAPGQADSAQSPVPVMEGEDAAGPADRSRRAAAAHHASGTRAKSRALRIAAAERFNLACFHAGTEGSARLAFEAVTRLSGPEAERLGLVFLFGGCGLGKTHLLHGGALRFSQTHPGAVVRVISADQFTTDYVTAVRSGRVESFRAGLRAADYLGVDDVGVLAGRPSTQKELVYLLDAVLARGGRVCMTGPAAPRSIPGLSEALVSRLGGGIAAEVRAPSTHTRAQIAMGVAGRRGIELDPAAAQILAEALPMGASVRELEGLVVKVEAIHRLLDGLTGGGKVGVLTVQRALGAMDGPAGPAGGPGRPAGIGGRGSPAPGAADRPIRFGAILEAACAQTGVGEAEVLASGRHALVVMARSLSAYVARRVTTMSFPEIARALGRPNHSTVITACQRVTDQIARGVRVSFGPERGEIGVGELAERILEAVRTRTQGAGSVRVRV